MREIKFRAWDNVRNKMFFTGEGNEVEIFFDSSGLIATDLTEHDWGFKKLEHLQYTQYTGLKDKNSQEIYENDVLLDPVTNEKYIVTYDDAYAMFFMKNISDKQPDYGFDAFDIDIGHDVFVIGNIHENPSLVEG